MSFWEKYNDCEQQVKAWHQDALKAEWANPNEIKLMYPSVSIMGQDRMVFNIKGNTSRLIVKINFEYQIIWLRFGGTIKGDELEILSLLIEK